MACVSVPVAADAAIDAGTAAEAGGALGAAGTGLAADAGADAFLPTIAADGLGGATSAIGGGSSALDALMGGITAGSAADAAPALADIGGDSAISGVGDAASDAATNAAGGSGGFIGGGATGDAASGLGVDGSPAALGAPSSAASAGGATAPGGSSWLSQLGAGAAKNPLNAALAGSSVLSGIQSLIPRKQVNTQQNAADVMATNPSFSNPNLPQYSMQNTATPYSGNWYTYGQQGQSPLYNAQPIPLNNANAAKKGGLIGHYAHGGMVRNFAMGGPVPGQPPMGMPSAPPQMPPQGMGSPPPRPPTAPPQQAMPPRKPMNPLAMQMAAHKIGVAIGKHMKARGMTPDGMVKGKGGGQDDIVPARLSNSEYVVPADVVSQLGDGSSNAGGKKLDGMLDNVRKHKTGNTKYPAKAKNPLAYIPKGKS